MRPTRTIGRMPTAAASDPSLVSLQRTAIQKPKNRWGAPVPREVTPAGLASAIRAARRGNPARWFAALEWFHSVDDELPGALASLVEAVLQEGPVVTPVDESADAKRQAEDVEAMLDSLDLVELIREGLESRLYGFNAAYLPWDVVELPHGRTVQAPTTYELLPRDWIYAEKATKNAEHNTLFVGDRPYFEYPAGSVLLFSARKLPSFTDIDFCRFGVGHSVARFAVYAFFNWEDWAGYNEVFGTPSIVGTLLEGWKPQDRALLEQAVFGLANDARGVLTDKAKLDFIRAEGGEGPFDRFGEAARKAIARIIKGESLTDNMGDRGSYAAMQTTNGIRLDFARGLARRLARMFMRRLIEPFCALNYGRCLVALDLPVQEVRNLVAEVSVDKGLQEMGLELSASELRERYGRRAPVDEDDRLVLPRQGGLGDLNIFGGGA